MLTSYFVDKNPGLSFEKAKEMATEILNRDSKTDNNPVL